jgi:hypothetical protein
VSAVQRTPYDFVESDRTGSDLTAASRLQRLIQRCPPAHLRRLENECKCVLAAEAAAAMTGKPPISLTPEVAEFT